jgi:transcription elongation factor Elf1
MIRRPPMRKSNKSSQKSLITIKCPYCGKDKSIEAPKDYGPVYISCNVCDKRFVVEKLARGFDVLTIAEAAYHSSDPHCYEIEMGASDEQ